MNETQDRDALRRNGPVTRPLVKMVRRPSTVDLIAVELRNAIYSGTLLPGSSVREAEVASQLGVSRGPLRESAQRLVQEGLLVARPGAGLRVATVGADQVAELYAARLATLSHRDGYVVRTDILDVHRTLMGQIADGEGLAAERTLAEHFQQTVDRLLGRLEEPFSTVTGEADGSHFSFNRLP